MNTEPKRTPADGAHAPTIAEAEEALEGLPQGELAHVRSTAPGLWLATNYAEGKEGVYLFKALGGTQ